MSLDTLSFKWKVWWYDTNNVYNEEDSNTRIKYIYSITIIYESATGSEIKNLYNYTYYINISAEMNNEFHYSDSYYLNNRIFKPFANYIKYITWLLICKNLYLKLLLNSNNYCSRWTNLSHNNRKV